MHINQNTAATGLFMYSEHDELGTRPYQDGRIEKNLLLAKLKNEISKELGSINFDFEMAPLGLNNSMMTMGQNLTASLAFLFDLKIPDQNVGSIIPETILYNQSQTLTHTYRRTALQYFLNLN